MYGNFSAYFDDYVNSILKKYKQNQPVYLTSPIGFDGATASQRVTCFSAQIDNDALLFGAHLNFSQLVNVKITDTATGQAAPDAWVAAGRARVAFRDGESTIYELAPRPVDGWPIL